jgi:ATPase subunit of ABC transporter with duplicated ATPase domains
MADACLLHLNALVAGYTTPVVGPVTLRVCPGQIVGLSGGNGSGKSTILKAITGVARIFSGTIERDPGLTLAHQWQRPERPPELALRGRELFGLLGADPRHAPACIQPLMNRPLHTFSGGQYQLLQAFAGLCSPVRLVLMDEPTNNLDGHALAALSTLLQELSPDRAVLLVSHERPFLEEYCSHLVEITA